MVAAPFIICDSAEAHELADRRHTFVADYEEHVVPTGRKAPRVPPSRRGDLDLQLPGGLEGEGDDALLGVGLMGHGHGSHQDDAGDGAGMATASGAEAAPGSRIVVTP